MNFSQLLLRSYDGLTLQQTVSATPNSGAQELLLDGRRWRIETTQDNHITCIRWTLLEGEPQDIVASAVFNWPQWTRNGYLLIPGAVYAGNRFHSLQLPYPPRHLPELTTTDVPTVVNDVPRLALEGPSLLELGTGDMALPAVGLWHDGHGAILSFAPFEPRTESQLSVQVTESETEPLRLELMLPSFRSRRPVTCPGNDESPDKPLRVQAGETLEMRFRLTQFESAEIPALFEQLWNERFDHALIGEKYKPTAPEELPISVAWNLLEEKYDRDNWDEKLDLYRTDPSPHSSNPYQTGWCGGLIATLPLLTEGAPTARQRAQQHLKNVFTNGVTASSFLWGKRNSQGQWQEDCWADAPGTHYEHRKGFTLIRRQTDALYYGLLQTAYLEQQGEKISSHDAALKGIADAFVKLWKTEGQFGQWIENTTGTLRVGNSTSAALAPAGLCAAYLRWNNTEYLEVAKASAEKYWREFSLLGVTTGGPGDALQSPDSESAYALVESYIALYETTGESLWLQRAEAAAQQFATWVMNYDFRFPATSQFGRLGMKTNGTVWANAQNKHSAPGICTHAGQGLLRLYRHTQDARYLTLLSDIVRALPQHVSREDRPIYSWDENPRPLPPGWVCERVNTCDWEGVRNVGAVFYGSTWSEVATMLSFAQLPSVYVHSEEQQVVSLDNINVYLDRDKLEINNPTQFPARVKVFVDQKINEPLPFLFGFDLPTVEVGAGESRSVLLSELV